MTNQIPKPLAEALIEGRLILFAGAGMSMPQLPGWTSLLNSMLAKGLDERSPAIIAEQAKIRKLIAANKLLAAARLLRDGLQPAGFCSFLSTAFRDARPDQRHRTAARLPFAGILTTNFDTLIEDAIIIARQGRSSVRVLNQTQIPELMLGLRERRLGVVHVHGEVTDSQSIILAKPDYTALKKNPQFRQYFQTLCSTYTFLFVGYSLQDEDLLLFLDEVFAKTGGHAGPHFVLEHPSKITSARRKEFGECYGIRFLEDKAVSGKSYPDILQFLQELEAILPVSAETAEDVSELFQDWGCRDLKQESSPGRLMFRGVRSASFGEELPIALAYTDRKANQQDVDALDRLKATQRVLVTRTSSRIDVPPGLRVFTRDELLDQLIPFARYLTQLRSAYENPVREEDRIHEYYVPLRARRHHKDARSAAKSKPENLDQIVKEWLQDESGNRRHLSILGEFGTGKSWFARRQAYLAATEGQTSRTPILFQLRNWSERFDLKSLVTSTLIETYGLKPAEGYRSFERLNREGRLLLIFDGFDEMVRNANSPRTAAQNFEAIAGLAKAKQSKILLTCRTEYFATEKEEQKVVLGRHPRDDFRSAGIRTREDWIEGREGFECAHVELFDDDQLAEALKKRGEAGLLPKLKRVRSLFEFAHRPVLLDMVLKTSGDWASSRRRNSFTLAGLYENYTERLLTLHTDDAITSEARKALIEECAWRMQSTQKLKLKDTDFEAIVRERFPVADSEEVIRRVKDLSSQASYFRREGDWFSFAHKSFLEYFVARRVAQSLRDSRNPNIPLTDVIVSFLPDLLLVEQARVEELDGMVKVPAGLFVYGSEEEQDLSIRDIACEYWIDKTPVTNAQYLAFLNKTGGANPKWIDPKWSRIKQAPDGALLLEAGYEMHPVVGVTWFGAEAYANHVGKRLPTEEEWERAARGVDGREYPWRGAFSKALCNTVESRIHDTTPVGSYPKGASPAGALDMSGNVWEWTASDWDKLKVLRGGSWFSVSDFARCASRIRVDPVDTGIVIGFRCART